MAVASLWLLVALMLSDVNGSKKVVGNVRNSDLKTDLKLNTSLPIRLPGNIVPIHYELLLHPNLKEDYFTGDISIHVEVKSDTDTILMHGEGFTDLSHSVREDTPQGKDLVMDSSSVKEHSLIMTKLKEKLLRGKKYVIRILFSSRFSRKLKGFYKSTYKTKDGTIRSIATTHFEATGARMAFPCFDEPAMKATFSIRIVRDEQHTALSNMPVERTEKRKDGLLVDYFQKSVKMSTYLVACIVSDFAHLSTKSSRGVKIGVWAPKHLISQAKYAIEVAPKILDFYEKFFKVDFPLPKLDLIAIPDFAMGAMENWGLITYRLTALLYDEKQSSSANKQRVVEVIAHELAHQWFGNLVTMKWWNDLWLNEGFARFVEFIGVGVVTDSWDEMTQFVESNLQNALVLDARYNSHPISVEVSDPADIGALFDGISYSKGASVLRMMRDFIGPDRFVNGLAAYLQQHKYGNAVSDDLWASLSAATHNETNVKKIMDTWTLQMGFPVVNIHRLNNTNIARATQERFVSGKGKGTKKSPFNYKWEIPLTFYFQNKTEKQRKWMHLKDSSVDLAWPHDGGWLKVNADQIGVYRVNYDEENWKALTTQLRDDHTKLSAADRSNLINDAFALASTGKLNYGIALGLTEYHETHYVPMSSAMHSLGNIGRLLSHSRSGYAKFEKYIRKLICQLVEKLGWEDTGSHLDKFLRKMVLRSAINHGHPGTIRKAKNIYRKWRDGHQSIPANLRVAVYLAGSKYGSTKDWMHMFTKYKSTIYPSEKRKLMEALAESSDKKLLAWYLKKSIAGDVIRSADTCLLIARIAGNPLAKRMTRDFVKKNWDSILRKHGQGTCLARVIPAVFGGNTKADYNEAMEFLNHHRLRSGVLAARQTLASIRNKIDWLEKNEKLVVEWFTSETQNE